ncbi:hypothetical protein T06_9131 [Trichinella sp. T6]|nr:hypothetical protein T06_9131 [Trichinella sp. T6]
MNEDNIVDVLKTIEECNIGKNEDKTKCYTTGILSLKIITKRKLIYLKSLVFPAKRQSCGWHFRYRHPDIAGNWLAHVFTDNTNPLKIKKRVEFDCSWHLVSCPKEEEENLAKMFACICIVCLTGVTVHGQNPSNAKRRNDGKALSRNLMSSNNPSTSQWTPKKLAINLQGGYAIQHYTLSGDYPSLEE